MRYSENECAPLQKYPYLHYIVLVCNIALFDSCIGLDVF